jgi:hypothetical protein
MNLSDNGTSLTLALLPKRFSLSVAVELFSGTRDHAQACTQSTDVKGYSIASNRRDLPCDGLNADATA